VSYDGSSPSDDSLTLVVNSFLFILFNGGRLDKLGISHWLDHVYFLYFFDLVYFRKECTWDDWFQGSLEGPHSQRLVFYLVRTKEQIGCSSRETMAYSNTTNPRWKLLLVYLAASVSLTCEQRPLRRTDYSNNTRSIAIPNISRQLLARSRAIR
jgi:hypothetical protein